MTNTPFRDADLAAEVERLRAENENLRAQIEALKSKKSRRDPFSGMFDFGQETCPGCGVSRYEPPLKIVSNFTRMYMGPTTTFFGRMKRAPHFRVVCEECRCVWDERLKAHEECREPTAADRR